MKLNNGRVNHVAGSAQFDEQRYCAIVQAVSQESVVTELRWAKEAKKLSERNL